jgi:uncharacterized protein YfaS (alpha-2-macroglobulin family)
MLQGASKEIQMQNTLTSRSKGMARRMIARFVVGAFGVLGMNSVGPLPLLSAVPAHAREAVPLMSVDAAATEIQQMQHSLDADALLARLAKDYGKASMQDVPAVIRTARRYLKNDRRWDARKILRPALVAAPDNAALWELFALSAYGSDRQVAFARWVALSETPDEKATALRQWATQQLGNPALEVAMLVLAQNYSPSDQHYTHIRILTGQDLKIESTRADGDAAVPSVCVVMSDYISPVFRSQIADYVDVAPQRPVTVKAHKDNICVHGLEHGQSYRITLKPGIKGKRGALKQAEDAVVTVSDRTPRAAFAGNGYIVPRYQMNLPGRRNQSVPVDVVNVAELDVQVAKVSDRAMIDHARRNTFASKDSWDLSESFNTLGSIIWDGTVLTQARKNQTRKVLLPLNHAPKMAADDNGEPLANHQQKVAQAALEPGVYLLKVQPKKPLDNLKIDGKLDRDAVYRWVMVTDLGISAVQGHNAHGQQWIISAHGLESGQPVEGAQVTILAANNRVLGVQATNAQGQAVFDFGKLDRQDQPMLAQVSRENGEDFSALRLTDQPFDLSDRGVAGRVLAGGLDAFMYGDRDLYRPGETLHMNTLIRDRHVAYVANVTPQWQLTRPDGVIADQKTLQDDGAGGYMARYTLPRSAMTGAWQATISVAGRVIGHTSVQVEDFVPERLDVKVAPQGKALTAAGPVAVETQVDWLYGAPAQNLKISTEAIIKPTRTVPGYAGYVFGQADDSFAPVRKDYGQFVTNHQGQAQFQIFRPLLPHSSQALNALVRVTALDTGGRAVSRTAVMPVAPAGDILGIRPHFENGMAPRKAALDFDIALLDTSYQPVYGRSLMYDLVHVQKDWYWMYRGGRWQYAVREDRHSVQSGAFPLREGRITLQANPVAQWGQYELEVLDPHSGAIATYSFRKGWSGSVQENVPTALDVKTDQPDGYVAKQPVKLRFSAPMDGTLDVMIATDMVLETHHAVIDDGVAEVEVTPSVAWGNAGVYALATVHGENGQRAIGVQWIPKNTDASKLVIRSDAPDVVMPRQTIALPFTIRQNGKVPQGDVMMTVAVVDEGVLGLTNYRTPHPSRHFYGQRRLQVELRDDYGRLLDPVGDGLAVLRSGGDAASQQKQGLPESNIKPLAEFRGPVRLDEDGKAVVSIPLPDFQGKVRVMALAYSASGMGAMDQPLIARDPLVMQTSLPRFLAPGDQASITVDLNNVDGGTISADLAPGQAHSARVQVSSDTIGTGRLTFTLTGPDGARRVVARTLAVRPAQAVHSVRRAGALLAGEPVKIDAINHPEYIADSVRWSVSAGVLPQFGISQILDQLDSYAYGCAEQTSSRLMPLVLASGLPDSLVAQAGLKTDKSKKKARALLANLLAKQRYDGAFGMWSGADKANAYITAYALDVLMLAQQAGYPVPDVATQNARKWLHRFVRSGDFDPKTYTSAAYAFYVLTRYPDITQAQATRIGNGQVRHFWTTYKNRLNGFEQALAAAALQNVGEGPLAAVAWASALGNSAADRGYYGSGVRNNAARIALALNGGTPLVYVQQHLQDVARGISNASYLSTQEKAWIVRMAYEALRHSKGALQVHLDESIHAYPDGYGVAAGQGNTLPALLQLGDAGAETEMAAFYGVRISGIPKQPLPATQQGFAIEKTFYNKQGVPIDLTKLRQGDTVVVVLDMKADPTQKTRHVLLADLLPAGLELDATTLNGGEALSDYGWLKNLTALNHTEKRDDRFVAVFDVPKSSQTQAFRVAYVGRAVSVGQFRVPAPQVEDMYAPMVRGRGAEVRMIVRP